MAVIPPIRCAASLQVRSQNRSPDFELSIRLCFRTRVLPHWAHSAVMEAAWDFAVLLHFLEQNLAFSNRCLGTKNSPPHCRHWVGNTFRARPSYSTLLISPPLLRVEKMEIAQHFLIPWAFSASGNTSGLHPEIGSSTLPRSTNTKS